MIGAAPDPSRPEEVRVDEVRRAYERGWDLTLLKGKKPMLAKWQKLRPLPLDTLLSHARRHNVGLRTGRSYGIFVLDDDTDDLHIAAQLELPPTVTVKTGRGGLHYYFHYAGAPLGNGTGSLPPGVDVRGEGGQVVYPGSIHPDTGLPYEWLPGHSPDEIEIAELPANVVKLIRTKRRKKNRATKAGREESPHQDGSDQARGPEPAPRSGTNRRLQNYAYAAIGYIVGDIARAVEGTRNKTLNSGAFAAGRFVGLGLLARERVEAELTTAATTAGLPVDEIESTLRCALDAGIAEAGTIQDLLEELDANVLGLPPSDSDERERPILVLVDGERHHAIDSILDVLREQDPPIVFEQLGRLVCLVPAVVHRRSVAVAQGICVRSLDDVYLPDMLGRLLRFRRETDKGLFVPINCPTSIAKTVLARAPHAKLPTLTAVICTPTLRPDGSLLATPGYDPQTGLFLDIAPGAFAGVPEHPTREDALRALADLKNPFSEFDFESDADRSAFLSALLTPFVRWSLRTAPMFIINAPRRGSGKTLLARSIGLIATGRSPWTLTQEHSDEESRKRWFAVLLAGASIVNIDNLEAPLGGATLCTILTEDRLTDRVLGFSQVQTVDTTKLVLIATGNNVEIAGDLTRRVLFCRIDPGVEFPEDRSFKLNLDHFLLDHRERLVVAALTVLRAFVEAGRPSSDVRPFGSFEEWSDLVRAALIWLGEPDPCRTRVTVEEGDAEREQTLAVIEAWEAAFGAAELTAAEVVASLSGDEGSDELRALEMALRPICGTDSAGFDTVALGRWLRGIRNRVLSGCRVEVASRAKGKVRWRVRRV
ncbi:MAG: bifunctional DNA primase/polymerase [Planctomycetota bacterium]